MCMEQDAHTNLTPFLSRRCSLRRGRGPSTQCDVSKSGKALCEKLSLAVVELQGAWWIYDPPCPGLHVGSLTTFPVAKPGSRSKSNWG